MNWNPFARKPASTEPAPTPPPQVLRATGRPHPVPGAEIFRYPLRYAAGQTTSLNFDRLPPPAATSDMSLAYREQAFTDDILRTETRFAVQTVIASTSLGALVLILATTASVPHWDTIIGYSAFMSVGTVGVAVLVRKGSLSNLLLAALLPPAIALASVLIGVLLQDIATGTCVLSALTLLMFFWCRDVPVDFFREWLLADPRLWPDERRSYRAIYPIRRPSWWLLGVVLLCVLGYATTSLSDTHSIETFQSIYFFIGASLTVAFAVMPSYRTEARLAQEMLARCVSYGLDSTEAPGLWRPRYSQRQRAYRVYALFGLLSLTLTEASTFYIPGFFLANNGEGLSASDIQYLDSYLHKPFGSAQRLIMSFASQHSSPLALLLFPVALILSMTLPSLLLLGIYEDSLEDLLTLKKQLEDDAVEEERPEWEWYVDRVRRSAHTAPDPLGGAIREADHLFLGVEATARFPLLLDRKVLTEHAYIVGETGSGKTALGLMPLLRQLVATPKENPYFTQSPPIVILDLKGDPALFNLLREECERHQTPFLFFTPEPHRATHRFNPFANLKSANRSLPQFAQLLLDSLSLSHGEGYGRSYYSRQSRNALLTALERNPDIQDFGELYRALEVLKKDKKDAFELISTIHALTFYPQLVTRGPVGSEESVQTIDMSRVLEEQQVVYFWLPAALESISVREIGKLALYSLLTAAIDRQRSGLPHRQAYLFVDEFQRLAGENFRIILEQARSFGVAAILANQTQADLVTPDVDLRPTVRTNTRFKQAFSVSDPQEVRMLIEGSGEEIALFEKWSTTDFFQSMRGIHARVSRDYTATLMTGSQRRVESRAWEQTLKPRLTRNDIIAASDHPLESIVQVSRGSGYTQFGGFPVHVRGAWPLTKEHYDRLSALPWPAITERETSSDVSIQTVERERTHESSAELAAQRDKLAEILRKKRRE